MALKLVVVALLALAGSSVLADASLRFVEDVRGGIGARIVSGWEANEGQFPYQLSLRMVNPTGGVTACGGSIVHPEWAITAAHCTATRVSVIVRAGAVNLTRPYYIFETTEYYNHPLYIEALQGIVQPNDIGVVKFTRALEFNDRVAPIRVQRSADRDRNYADLQLTASGWGVTWTSGSSPENLNWVYLLGTSNADCLAAFSGSSIIQDSTICARGYNDTTQSTCSGDSGGPLTVVDKDGRVTLVGVASFVSATGCHTGFPAGFCRPGYYHDWFLEVTGVDLDWNYDESETTTEADTTPKPGTDGTTEAGATDGTTESGATDATTESGATDATTESGATDATTESGATDATTESGATDATTESGATDATTESGATDGTTESGATDATTESGTTDSENTEKPVTTPEAESETEPTPAPEEENESEEDEESSESEEDEESSESEEDEENSESDESEADEDEETGSLKRLKSMFQLM